MVGLGDNEDFTELVVAREELTTAEGVFVVVSFPVLGRVMVDDGETVEPVPVDWYKVDIRIVGITFVRVTGLPAEIWVTIVVEEPWIVDKEKNVGAPVWCTVDTNIVGITLVKVTDLPAETWVTVVVIELLSTFVVLLVDRAVEWAMLLADEVFGITELSIVDAPLGILSAAEDFVEILLGAEVEGTVVLCATFVVDLSSSEEVSEAIGIGTVEVTSWPEEIWVTVEYRVLEDFGTPEIVDSAFFVWPFDVTIVMNPLDETEFDRTDDNSVAKIVNVDCELEVDESLGVEGTSLAVDIVEIGDAPDFKETSETDVALDVWVSLEAGDAWKVGICGALKIDRIVSVADLEGIISVGKSVVAGIEVLRWTGEVSWTGVVAAIVVVEPVASVIVDKCVRVDS